MCCETTHETLEKKTRKETAVCRFTMNSNCQQSTAIKQPGIDTAARDRSRATLNFTFAIATSPPRRPGSKRSCRASAQPLHSSCRHLFSKKQCHADTSIAATHSVLLAQSRRGSIHISPKVQRRT